MSQIPLVSIPDNWKIERLDRLFQIRNEPARIDDPPVSAFIDGTVTLRSNRPDAIIKGSGQEIGYKHIEIGDLVISGMNAHLGGLGISDSSGKCTPVYTVMKKTIDLDSRFISYYLWHAAKCGYIKSLVNAVRYNSADFGPETIKQFMVPVPPIEEQRRIADYLDEQCKVLDQLYYQHEKVQANVLELTKSEREKLIRGGATGKRILPGWLGEINANWDTIRSGRIASFKSGVGFPDEYQGKSYGDFPFVKVADLGSADSLGILKTAENYIDKFDANLLGARVAPAGTIVFPKVGAALLNNRRAILGVPSIFDNNVMGLLFKEGNNRFWYHVLRSVDMGRIMNPGPVPSIGASQVSEIVLPFPPLEEQSQIASRLDEIDDMEAKLLTKNDEAKTKIAEYKKSLISGAVLGQTLIDSRKRIG